ncbi:MAG: phage tail protein, partial [Acidimicrobiia bacterium]
MALPDMDTSVGWSFGFEFDGVLIRQIQEVAGLKMENDVIELKHNTS